MHLVEAKLLGSPHRVWVHRSGPLAVTDKPNDPRLHPGQRVGLLFRGRPRRIKLRRGQVKVVGLWIKCHRFGTVLTSLSLFLRWSAPGDQITEAGRSMALQEGSVWKEAFRHAYNTFFGNGVSTNEILIGGFLNKTNPHLSS